MTYYNTAPLFEPNTQALVRFLFGSYFWYGIKTLLWRRKNNCFGDAFGVLRQPLRPSAAAAAIENAAIEKPLLLRPFSIAAAAVEEQITFTFMYSTFLQISD